MTARVVPFATWPSPISAADVAAASVRLGDPVADGESVWWTESRPREQGRSVLVRWRPGGSAEDVMPPPWSVRTRVYEYGGGAFAVAGDLVCFSHDADQRVYRLEPGGEPRAITPDGPQRYADGVVDRRRGVLLAVCEDHGAGTAEPVHALVRIDLDGRATPEQLVAGDDFYAAPRPSPDGTRLAWIAWNHPDMPWDGTTLWVAELDASGRPHAARRVAGGPEESVLQPRWSPAGVLHFVSDAGGWWNLWRLASDGPEPLRPMAAEFAAPPWSLGTASYAFTSDGGVACAFASGGRWRVARLDPATRRLDEIPMPFTEVPAMAAAGNRLVLRAGGPTTATSIVLVENGAARVLRAGEGLGLDPAAVARPEPLEVAGVEGRSVHAVFYRPHHPGVRGPDAERPPLLVRAHGGPTGASSTALDPLVQFWTSRGFAFLDVDYGGSTGYGRAYRARLDGQWGVVDVEDVAAAAQAVAAGGAADPGRLVVRGASAGGFTALRALVTHGVFRGAVVWYGVTDLEALQRETHKFESRYEHRLVAPYPDGAALYRARSPLRQADRIGRPVLLLHGTDDRVVPPSQARALADALRERGVPVAHLELAGEGHGFRQAASIQRALVAEATFHAAVLGLPAPGTGAGPAPVRPRAIRG